MPKNLEIDRACQEVQSLQCLTKLFIRLFQSGYQLSFDEDETEILLDQLGEMNQRLFVLKEALESWKTKPPTQACQAVIADVYKTFESPRLQVIS